MIYDYSTHVIVQVHFGWLLSISTEIFIYEDLLESNIYQLYMRRFLDNFVIPALQSHYPLIVTVSDC